jgi:hypothetical protein
MRPNSLFRGRRVTQTPSSAKAFRLKAGYEQMNDWSRVAVDLVGRCKNSEPSSHCQQILECTRPTDRQGAVHGRWHLGRYGTRREGTTPFVP